MRKLLTCLLAVLLCCSLAACSSSEEGSDETDVEETVSYTVGICQLVEHDALDAATQGFQDAIVEALGEENVTFILQNASGDATTCATICNSLVQEGVDLIMANGTAALQAAVSATETIPVLGTSITDYATALGLDVDSFTGVVGGNVSGCSDLAPIDQQAAELMTIFPDTQNVTVLYCSSEANSKYQANAITAALEEYGVTVTEVTFVDSTDVASATEQACVGADVIYIPTDNTCASCTGTIEPIVTANNVPVFAGEEGICSGCGVATLSISYYDLGVATGEMAVQVLTGAADISTMEISYAATVTKKYNAELAEYYGVTIPEDYVAIE